MPLRNQSDWSHPVYRPDGSGLEVLRDADGDVYCIEGHVITPHGPVSIYYMVWRDGPRLLLSFIHAGRRHHRRYEGEAGRKHIVTLANRFAHEIVEEA